MVQLKDVLDGEVWKRVKGYRGYFISTIGRLQGPQKPASFGFNNGHGYRRGTLVKRGWQKMVMIHRLVAEAFISNPECKPHVNHKDGDKSNNRVENLEWATVSENALHAFANGLRKAHPVRGEKNYAAKLNEAAVRSIRASELSHSKLAVVHGVSRSVIQKIKERKSWKHI